MQMETNTSEIERNWNEENSNYTSNDNKENISDEDIKEIFARVGDPIIINLEREGWIFLGNGNNEQLNGLSLVSKEQMNGSTNFTFNAYQLGYYELKFLLQDNLSGTQRIDTVIVSVLTDAEFISKLNNAN